MSENDKLFLLIMEDCRPDQVEARMSIAETKRQPIGELGVETVRSYLARLSREECEEAIEILKEGGIDWAKVK
jgi:hypothetical protein